METRTNEKSSARKIIRQRNLPKNFTLVKRPKGQTYGGVNDDLSLATWLSDEWHFFISWWPQKIEKNDLKIIVMCCCRSVCHLSSQFPFHKSTLCNLFIMRRLMKGHTNHHLEMVKHYCCGKSLKSVWSFYKKPNSFSPRGSLLAAIRLGWDHLKYMWEQVRYV